MVTMRAISRAIRRDDIATAEKLIGATEDGAKFLNIENGIVFLSDPDRFKQRMHILSYELLQKEARTAENKAPESAARGSGMASESERRAARFHK